MTDKLGMDLDDGADGAGEEEERDSDQLMIETEDAELVRWVFRVGLELARVLGCQVASVLGC